MSDLIGTRMSDDGRTARQIFDDVMANPARGFAVLEALHAVAERHAAKPAEVALAWLLAQPGVTAPIASATKPEHVASFARAVELVLSPADLAALNL